MYILLGFFISIVIGHFVTKHFYDWLGRKSGLPIDKPEQNKVRVPAWITGSVERIFFTFIILLNISGAAPAMMAWISAKLLINWNSNQIDDDNKTAWAFRAGLSGLVSMLFAVLGGCIGRLSFS